MSKEQEYQDAVITAVLCAKMLSVHDLPALLEAIEHGDSVGPVLEPTLWREKRGAMVEDRAALRAALPLHEFGKKLAAIRAEKGERSK